MTPFLNWFVNAWKSVLSVLDACRFDFMGLSVSLLAVLSVLMIIGFVIAMFWRGAKT